MTLELKTQIEISAPPSRVWEVLTDFAAYPRWNPFIVELKGRVNDGATIRFRFQFVRGIRIWTEAKILRFEPHSELRWAAHVLSPRLFNGERHIAITPASESTATFHHSEIFSGLLVPLIGPLLRRSSGPYRAMNSALKTQVEERR